MRLANQVKMEKFYVPNRALVSICFLREEISNTWKLF